MMYDVIKALHIIFIVTWFAGLFYMFRLFIYHTEASKKKEPDRTILTEQFVIMEKRLWYIISWPSCILTFIFGPWLVIMNPSLLQLPFMWIKLFFVFMLFLYQLLGQRIFSKMKNGNMPYNSFVLRLLNEVATVILIAIVFLISMRSEISWLWGTAGILGISMLLLFSVKAYRKRRSASQIN